MQQISGSVTVESQSRTRWERFGATGNGSVTRWQNSVVAASAKCASANRGAKAYRPTSLDLRKDETLGLVGESGCGKSTLARTLRRPVEPTSGTITLDDARIHRLDRRRLRRARQVTDLILELQEQDGIAFLFISHDIAVVERVGHRVAVMYRGQIVETGPTQAVLKDPQHPIPDAFWPLPPCLTRCHGGRVVPCHPRPSKRCRFRRLQRSWNTRQAISPPPGPSNRERMAANAARNRVNSVGLPDATKTLQAMTTYDETTKRAF